MGKHHIRGQGFFPVSPEERAFIRARCTVATKMSQPAVTDHIMVWKPFEWLQLKHLLAELEAMPARGKRI